MIKELIDINTNKLHDELVVNGITPVLVESKDGVTWITFKDDTNLELVQQIVDAHDPTPLPPQPSEKERIEALEQAMLEMILGGM